MPRPTTMATIIRTTLRAPLFFGAVDSAAGGPGTEGVADEGLPTGWVAPHLVQNFAEPSNVAPHALQNAIASPPVHYFPILALTAECIPGSSAHRSSASRAGGSAQRI